MRLQRPLLLEPEYRPYIWGGSRLRPGVTPTAEAWVVYEGDRIASGPFTGQTLAQVAAQAGPALLGQAPARPGFPVLIKLLDCAQWLSVQVHPDDAQAAALEGPGAVGKTEAWHVLEAAPGAQLIAGLQPGVTRARLAQALQAGGLLELVQYQSIQAGDTLLLNAGTLHALGPGLLLYELQQSSDITYRAYDWGRPATAHRPLHLEKSLAAIHLEATARPQPRPALQAGAARLCQAPYFTLELLEVQGQALGLDTQGASFHALTVISGAVELRAAGATLLLERFDTAVTPADCGAYTLQPTPGGQVLKASL
jgi:mannose-6-phosphate isomerase